VKKNAKIYLTILSILSLVQFFRAEAYEKHVKIQNFPQTYKKTILWENLKVKIERMFSEDGDPDEHFRNEKTDKQFRFGVDGQENAFFLFKRSFRIINKKGKEIQRVNLNKENDIGLNLITVDLNGDVCVFNPLSLKSKTFIYLKETNYEKPVVVNRSNNGFRLSNGILYSKKSGKTYYSKSEKNKISQKEYLNAYGLGYKKNGFTVHKFRNKTELPLTINGYQLESITEIDNNNSVYIEAFDGKREKYGILKLSSDLRIVAFIPTDYSIFNNGFLEIEKEIIYIVEKEANLYRLVKYEKSN
jgi:hypothetical protein